MTEYTYSKFFLKLTLFFLNRLEYKSEEINMSTFLCLNCQRTLFIDGTLTKQQINIYSGIIGDVTDHARNCSKTSGLFLCIEDCSLLYLHINRADDLFSVSGYFGSAPYLDDNQNVDEQLKYLLI